MQSARPTSNWHVSLKQTETPLCYIIRHFLIQGDVQIDGEACRFSVGRDAQTTTALKRADSDPSLTGGAGVSLSRTPMFETVNGLAVLLGVSAPRAQFLLISKGERAPSFVNLR